jgi:hypothetical protein
MIYCKSIVFLDTQSNSKNVERPKRHKHNKQGMDLKNLIEMKKWEYKRRDERHEEKCTLEKMKIDLLTKILEKQ